MKTRHVLLIENNRANRTVYAGALASYGYTVTEAHDADEARQHLFQGYQPDIVIMNVRFHEDSTVAFVDEIRSQQAHIIVAAGQPFQDARVDAFLSKPIDLSDLLNTMQAFN